MTRLSSVGRARTTLYTNLSLHKETEHAKFITYNDVVGGSSPSGANGKETIVQKTY